MARKRYVNKSDLLQVLYDERGTKREIVPNGTIILDEKTAMRFPFLQAVPDGKKAKES